MGYSLSFGLAVIAAVLAGCGAADTISKGFGTVLEANDARAAALEEADDAKCKDLAFKPGTKGYSNCRLKMEQIRATEQAAASSPAAKVNAAKKAAVLQAQ
jgi:hypothetical protein